MSIKLLPPAILILAFCSCVSSQSTVDNSAVLELSPAQSMSVTGKGPGQDAAINPFQNQTSISVISNTSKAPFVARLKRSNQKVEYVEVSPGETVELTLEPDTELYLDSDYKTKARVSFRPGK